MGTRSLTIMQDSWENHKEIAILYRQFDGYPEGHGKELAEFLNGIVIVNGIGCDLPHKIANGGTCLAAQIVTHFKDEPGNFYLLPAHTRNCGEEYIYIVTPDYESGGILLEVKEKYKRSKSIFNGTPQEFLSWLESVKEA